MKKSNMGDPVQLQQKIIYFKAELAKYKEKVKDYQENYHYALLEKLREEKNQLLEDKSELAYQVEKLEKEIGSARELLSEQQSDRSQLQIRNKALQERIQKQESEFRVIKDNLTEQIDHTSQEKQKLQNKLIAQEQTYRDLQGEHTKLVKQAEKQTGGENDQKRLMAKIEELQGTIASLTDQISDYQKAEKHYKSQLDESQAKIKTLSAGDSSWGKWKQAKEETIEELTRDNLILKSQNEKLKKKLESDNE